MYFTAQLAWLLSSSVRTRRVVSSGSTFKVVEWAYENTAILIHPHPPYLRDKWCSPRFRPCLQVLEVQLRGLRSWCSSSGDPGSVGHIRSGAETAKATIVDGNCTKAAIAQVPDGSFYSLLDVLFQNQGFLQLMEKVSQRMNPWLVLTREIALYIYCAFWTTQISCH